MFTAQALWQASPRLVRISKALALPDPNQPLHVHEVRCSVALKSTWQFDLPVFSLITFADSFTGIQDLGRLWDTEMWTAVGIRPCVRVTGLPAFAFRICSLLPEWEAQWSQTLDQVDAALHTKVREIHHQAPTPVCVERYSMMYLYSFLLVKPSERFCLKTAAFDRLSSTLALSRFHRLSPGGYKKAWMISNGLSKTSSGFISLQPQLLTDSRPFSLRTRHATKTKASM